MRIPDFTAHTKQVLAQQSAMICNNPSCSTVTIGPVDTNADPNQAFVEKIGEAAHIRAARPGEARFDETMTNEQRAAPANGIWLCSSCHTMIDKNEGVAYPTETLVEWKRDHATFIRSLLLTHLSPLAKLRLHTQEGLAAQFMLDTLENHGALYQDMSLENYDHVGESIALLRSELQQINKELRIDANLKRIVRNGIKICRDTMNCTSTDPGAWPFALPLLRRRMGQVVDQLCTRYGCTPGAGISSIVIR